MNLNSKKQVKASRQFWVVAPKIPQLPTRSFGNTVDHILDECLNLFLTSKTSSYRQLQEKIVSDLFTVV